MTRIAAAGALVLALAICASAAFAAAPSLSGADRAWIAKCVADRKNEGQKPARLRRYCACMQATIDDNEPFTVSGLEHAYPPAHVLCRKESSGR